MAHKYDILQAEFISGKGMGEDIKESLDAGFEVGFVYLIKRTGGGRYTFTTRLIKDGQWEDELLAELLTADIEHLKKRKG